VYFLTDQCPGRETTTPGHESRRYRAPSVAWAWQLKSAAIALLFASTAALAAGDDGNSCGSIPQTDIRLEIQSVYKFEPHAWVSSPPAPFLAHEASQPDLHDIVESPPPALSESRVMNRLHAAVVQERANSRAAMVASRLGIGVSSVRLGRYFALGAATAFYIPVAVGVSVVW
jgi:hypothetical protein